MECRRVRTAEEKVILHRRVGFAPVVLVQERVTKEKAKVKVRAKEKERTIAVVSKRLSPESATIATKMGISRKIAESASVSKERAR